MLYEFFEQIAIHPQLILVVPALMIVGYALKKTPFIKDWLIVWILLIFGTVAGIFTLGFSVNGIANGILSAGVAITSHQLIKQSRCRNND